MSISNTIREVAYTGNGATTAFPFNFLIPDGAERIYLREIATGTDTLLSEPAYSISGLDDPNGGTVTYNPSSTPIASTHKLIILREVDYTQDMDINNQDGFHPDVLEAQLDKTVMGLQQVAAEADRALKVGVGETPPSITEFLADMTASTAAAAASAASASTDAGRAETARDLAIDAAATAAGAKPYATRTAVKALTPVDGETIILTEGVPARVGRFGTFVFDTGNLSALVTADPQEGVYIAPDSDPTGASGAWVRSYERLSAAFFGASVSATRAANTTALQAAIDFAQTYSGELFFPELYATSATVTVSNTLRLLGVSAKQSGISCNGGNAINLRPSTTVSDNNTWSGIFNLSLISTAGGRGLDYVATGAEYLSNWIMEGCYLSGVSGYGASFDSTASTVGIFSCTIRRNWISGGIQILEGGDSITILENTINGSGVGVFATLKSGVRQFIVRNNNITTLSECIYLQSVIGAIVEANWMETPYYLGNYTGLSGAICYLPNCTDVRVLRNTIQPLAAVGGGFVPASHAVMVAGTSSGNIIDENDIAIGSVNHIYIPSASQSRTTIGARNRYTGAARTISDAGTDTIYESLKSTYTGSLTGCTTVPTGSISYTRQRDVVTLSIPAIAGTSNTTTATITGMPVAIRPKSTRIIMARITDNSLTSFGLISIAADGTITLFKDAAAGAFTASGTKGIAATTVSYQIE